MSSFPKHSYTEQALDHVFPQSNSDTGQAPAPAQGYRSERSPLITRAPIVNSTAARLDSFPSGHQSTNQLSPFDNNRNDSNNSNNNKYSKSHTLLDSEQPRGQLLQPQPRSYGTTRGQDEEQQQQSPTPTIIASSSDFLGPASSTPGMDKYTYQPGRLSVREVAIQEFKILLRYSWPVVLTYVLQNSLQLASLISLGHLGSIELAASSLASMFAAVTCWSVSLGTATALDTLCSQSYTSHHPHTLGLHLQRAILVLMLLFVPIAGIWLSSEYIFSGLLGQDPILAEHAAIFLKGLLPGAPAFLIFECVKKYLQAQGIMQASTYVLLVVFPLNAVLNYLLVWNKYIGMGYIGAPIATSISYWSMLLLLLLYIRFVDGRQGWGGWSRESLTGWTEFLKLAIPGCAMVVSEWWAFEVVSLAASYLGTVSLAAQSVVVQTSGLLYTIPFGISIAASNRVGNLIGMGDARTAMIASRCSIAMAILFGLVNSMMLLLLKDRWGRLFSEDVEVVKTVAMILPLVAFFQIGDGLAGVGGGVLRGVGLQHLGAYLNLIAYYIVAFPLGYLLAFRCYWGLEGLWAALCVALWMVGLGEIGVIVKTDWVSEVARCQARIDLLTPCGSALEDAEQSDTQEFLFADERRSSEGDGEDEDDERSLVDSFQRKERTTAESSTVPPRDLDTRH